MRGWKPVGAAVGVGVVGAGHSAPTMRGWKLRDLHPEVKQEPLAGHSAPTMRGWKLIDGRTFASEDTVPDTQPRQ